MHIRLLDGRCTGRQRLANVQLIRGDSQSRERARQQEPVTQDRVSENGPATAVEKIKAGIPAVKDDVQIHPQLFKIVTGDGDKQRLDRNLNRALLAEVVKQAGQRTMGSGILGYHELAVDLLDRTDRTTVITPTLRSHRILDEFDDLAYATFTLRIRLGLVIIVVTVTPGNVRLFGDLGS